MNWKKAVPHIIENKLKPQDAETQKIQKKRTQSESLRAHIRNDFVTGVALTIVLMLLKWGVEHWEFGRQIEQMTYSMLQLRLLSRSEMEDRSVIVADINGLAQVPIVKEGKTEFVTPRDSLLQVVKSIAHHKPRAIGIDLNFSPDSYGYVTPFDPALFDAFLNIRRQGIPVFVGVYDSVALGPGRWLGRPEYKSLAAYIAIPNPERTESSIRMIEWVQPAGVTEPCFSLAYALANTEHKPIPWLLMWAVGRTNNINEKYFTTSEFLIDYSQLEKLIENRIPGESPAMIAGFSSKIANKIVLIGKASPGQTIDQFNIPGRGMPVPGVYVHASAAYTLLQAPLYRLTHKGRLAADALAAMLVFCPILLIKLYYSRRPFSEAASHHLQGILTAIVIVGIIVAGHFLVGKIRLIWTDYLMVIGALLLHPTLERFANQIVNWFRFSRLRE
jgi:CHASE2 domain-containing sensor protein